MVAGERVSGRPRYAVSSMSFHPSRCLTVRSPSRCAGAGWSPRINVAAADFLHPPEIVEMDLNQYTGKPGEEIRVRALDDVEVTQVGIVIMTDQNVLVEKGKLVSDKEDKMLWRYTTTATAGVTHVKMLVDAADLPGHITQKAADKTF